MQVGEAGRFEVTDTRKQGEGAIAHIGRVSAGAVSLGAEVMAQVNSERRTATRLNHSATHLMHAALRQVLGEHVQQKGSLVDPERLRFDFSHFEPVTPEQLHRIETLVNDQIRANAAVETRIMPVDQAMQMGAMALFGEKYGDQVRVLSIGDFSVELCGGTHVTRAGDIGLFKILSETGIAAGVRRIEAVTGARALDYIDATEKGLSEVAGLVKAGREEAPAKVSQLLDRNRRLEKELETLKAKLASSQGSDLASQAQEVGGIKVLAARLDGADARILRDTVDQLKNKLGSAAGSDLAAAAVSIGDIKVLAANLEGADPKSLRDTMDQLKNKLGTAVIVLATVSGDKVSLVAGVTKAETDRIKAGQLVNHVATQVGGKGGGRPDLAQAGGSEPHNLDAALASVAEWVASQIGASQPA